MATFFLVVQLVFFYGLSIYCILKKNELAIFYLPVLLFVEKITDTPSPAFLFYAIVSVMVILLAVRNGLFFRSNIWAFLLIVYFLLLLNNSSDFEQIRPLFFGVMWLFILVPLIPNIYKKYTSAVVFKELSNASLLILILFIANALVSSVYKFAPMQMYGFTSGILFGNLFAASFNPLSIALFIVLLRGINERKSIYLIVGAVSFIFIMLTLRRTVLGLSALGILIALLTIMTRQKAKMVFLTVFLMITTGYLIYSETGFLQEFKGRVEQRKLDERELTEEKRFLEYSLLYDDMFTYHAYSPWFGYELFNSAGNYGKGILGERSLHGDISNLLHSSGIIGVVLYLFMAGTAFLQAVRGARRYQDKLIILFCVFTFVVYTVTGRYTEVAASLLLFLVLMLPLAKEETETTPA